MRFLKKHLLFFIPVLFLLAALCPQADALAADRPAKITKCQLVSSGKVSVTASIPDTEAVSGSRCYLFAFSLSDSKISSKMKPLASKRKAKSLTFTVNLNNSKTTSLLYSRFALASKKNGAYKVISNARYISNPKKAARYKYSFPTAVSKKGLQISSNMLEDAVELNVRHAALNIVFSELIATRAEQNKTFSLSYKYHGKTYWFRKALINSYDAQLTALKENNAIVSAILLLGWRSDLKNLIYPDGRKAGHSFYAWNTKDAAAREQLQATLSFLASRYSGSSAKHGRIVNWILGNEVNNYNTYNYAGKKTLNQYAKIYADAFRMAYNTVTSIYSNARVYISLDHLWNRRVKGCFTARETLDAFAASLKKRGNIRWNLAFHPYSSPLTEPKFWENADGKAAQKRSASVISMGNIGVLTSYIREKYGSDTHIILSEQGYTSVRHIKIGNKEIRLDAQDEQAAAIAYSYYLTESDDMLDSFIMNRHVDHQAEISQGLNLGLWTTDRSSSLPEWAGEKKKSWNTFKYMDSNLADIATADSLAIIGIEQWSDAVPGLEPAMYSKNTYASASLNVVKSYQKTASVPAAWRAYGAVARTSKGNGLLRAVRSSRKNRSSLWGFSQTFSKGLNFSSSPYFYTALKVHGASAGKAQITVRFFSGTKNILESSRIISCGRAVRLGVSLENWSRRSSVKKIQILVSPVSGGWSDDAYLTISEPVRGR